MSSRPNSATVSSFLNDNWLSSTVLGGFWRGVSAIADIIQDSKASGREATITYPCNNGPKTRKPPSRQYKRREAFFCYSGISWLARALSRNVVEVEDNLFNLALVLLNLFGTRSATCLRKSVARDGEGEEGGWEGVACPHTDRKSTRLNSSHVSE